MYLDCYTTVSLYYAKSYTGESYKIILYLVKIVIVARISREVYKNEHLPCNALNWIFIELF